MPQPLPPPPRKKSPEELLRETVNAAAVSVVATGFTAIDHLAKHGSDWLKGKLIEGISPPKKKRTPRHED